jgi:hypothetical protein
VESGWSLAKQRVEEAAQGKNWETKVKGRELGIRGVYLGLGVGLGLGLGRFVVEIKDLGRFLECGIWGRPWACFGRCASVEEPSGRQVL